MRKIRFASLFLLILVLQFGSVYALKEDLPIETVRITGIDYPYSTGSVLDTTANISDSSYSIISKVYWTQTAESLNKVTVTVRPKYDYHYDENTKATINGNSVSVFINEDKHLEISYVFPIDTSEPNPSSSSSLKHVINVLYTVNGRISPNPIRAPHKKNFTVQIIPDEGYEVKDVLVDGESVGAVTEYTFKRVMENHKIKAYFKPIEGYVPNQDKEVIESGDVEVPTEKEFLFQDVSESDWYYDSVKYVFNENIFNGTSTTEFSPNKTMTRAMLVKVLYNIEMKKSVISGEISGESIFEDVPENEWYTDAIIWASTNGIVNGVGSNLFAPNKEITREQATSILYRYAKYSGGHEIEISDLDISNWADSNEVSEYATESIIWALSNEIITGKSNNMIVPKGLATRAEVAKMFTSLLNK